MERTIKRVEFAAQRRIEVLRVAAYARVSTGKDAMLHSLSAQVSYYSNLIQKHPGWLYSGVYADAADIIGLNQNPKQMGVDLVLFFSFSARIGVIESKKIA